MINTNEQESQAEDKKQEQEQGTPDKAEKTSEDKTFTQAELDDIIAKRIERERKKYEGFEDMKNKLTTYEQQMEEKRLAELTEKERAEELAKNAEEEKQTLAQQLETLQKQVQQEKIANEFIKLATAQGIAYIDDAFKLANLSTVEVSEDGKVLGVEDVVKALIENKPYLVKQTTEPKQIGGGSQTKQSGEKTSEQLLKEADEKAKKTGRIEDRVAYAKLKRVLGL